MKYNIEDIINGFELIERWSILGRSLGIWVCPCCGEWFEAQVGGVVRGAYRSCGCMLITFRKQNGRQKGEFNHTKASRELISKVQITHGQSRNPSFKRAGNILNRVYNPKHSRYYFYNPLGCDWTLDQKLELQQYLISLPSFPGEDLLYLYEVHRINNRIGYYPGNFEFLTYYKHRKAHDKFKEKGE